MTWATKVDLATGRPVEMPGARYETGPAKVAPVTARRPQLARDVLQSPAPAWRTSRPATWECGTRMRGSTSRAWQSPDWKSEVPGDGVGVTNGAVPAAAGWVTGTLQAWDPVRAAAGLGGAASRTLECGDDDDRRQSRLSGPGRWQLRRPRCPDRRGAMARQPRSRHLGATDHVCGERPAIRGAAGRLGRRDGGGGRIRRRRARVGLRCAAPAPGGVLPGGNDGAAFAAASGRPQADRV